MRDGVSYPTHAHTVDREVISGSATHSQESAQAGTCSKSRELPV